MPLNDLGKNKALMPFALTTAMLTLLLTLLFNTQSASADISNVETRVASGTANATSIKSLAIACPTGKSALGGGVSFSNPGAEVNVVTSAPQGATGDGSDNGTGWVAEFNNQESVSKTVYIWVICGTVS